MEDQCTRKATWFLFLMIYLLRSCIYIRVQTHPNEYELIFLQMVCLVNIITMFTAREEHSWNASRYSSMKLWMENSLIMGHPCSSQANESICFGMEADMHDRWWCTCQWRNALLFGFVHSHSVLSLLKWGNVPQQQLLITVTNTLCHTQIHCAQAALNASEYHWLVVTWDIKSFCIKTHTHTHTIEANIPNRHGTEQYTTTWSFNVRVCVTQRSKCLHKKYSNFRWCL